MLTFLRKNQYGIMLIVAILVVIAFVFWDPSYRATAQGELGVTKKIKVADRVFRSDEIDNIKKSFQALYSLGDNAVYTHAMTISSLSQKIVQENADDGTTPPDAVINTAIIREESRRYGIDVSDAEVEAKIRTFSRFQTPEGQFDGEAWSKYIDAQGGTSGQRRQLLFDGIKDMIRLEKLTALIGIDFPMSTAEVDWTYNQRYQKTTVALVDVPKDKFAEQTVTDEEIQKYYDENKEKPELKSAEQRSIQTIFIANPKEEELKDLPEDQKEEKRKAVRMTAKVLADQLTPDERAGRSFAEIAAAVSRSQNLATALEVKTYGPFVQKSPPAEIASENALITDLFKRTTDDKTNVINGTNGYYAYELGEIIAPQTQPLDAVKESIITKLKEEKQNQQLSNEINKVKDQLKAALAEKKSITEAATAAGYSARELPAFSQQKPLTSEPQFHKISSLAASLNAGELSEAFSTGTGSTFIYVVKKELPKDPAMEDQKKNIRDTGSAPMAFGMGQTNSVFNAWFDQVKAKVIRDLNTTK